MNTHLQQAAQAVINQCEVEALWASYPWLGAKLAELRKALDAELAQSVEPVAYGDFANDGKIRIWTRFATCENIKDLKPLYLHPPQPQATTPAVPDGYVLVPIEPTPLMLDALQHSLERIDSDRQIYQAMVKAAQGEKP